MSRKGDCWDNAVTETLFASLEVERLHGMRFETHRPAKDEAVSLMELYNFKEIYPAMATSARWPFEEFWCRHQRTLAA